MAAKLWRTVPFSTCAVRSEHGVIKEASDDGEAVRELLRHLLFLAGMEDQRRNGFKLRAVVGVPAEAMQTSRQQPKTAMEGIAYSVVLVSEPFAAPTAPRGDCFTPWLWISAREPAGAVCVMQGRYPTEGGERTLPNAGPSIDARLLSLLQEHHPEAEFSIHMVQYLEGEMELCGRTERRRKGRDQQVDGRPTEFDITDDMRAACESIVAPIAETVADLVSRVSQEYQQRVLNNIVLAGGSSLITG